jgi:dTDP-6-deoxy-L-talose 4-dehydrogenase (NAD+)
LAEEAGAAWTWFRVFYPYGEGEHHGRMPSALMRKLAAGEELELKTPDSVKDYIHVKDAAEAMLAALECKLAGPVNIGTGTGLRIMDLALAIARCCGSDAGLVRRAPTPAEDPFPVTVADTAKLRSTGWRPSIGLEAGLARLQASLRQD